jgi:hypothetical protein
MIKGFKRLVLESDTAKEDKTKINKVSISEILCFKYEYPVD